MKICLLRGGRGSGVYYCYRQTIKLPVGALLQLLYAWLKEVFKNLSNHTATWLYFNWQLK